MRCPFDLSMRSMSQWTIWHCQENIKVCAQNCGFKGCGAFTGETAVEQLKASISALWQSSVWFGCWWVVGWQAPRAAFAGHIATPDTHVFGFSLCLSVCPSVRLSVCLSLSLSPPFSIYVQSFSTNWHAPGARCQSTCLEDLKIEWVLLGHSERREYFLESNELLAQKLCHGDRLLCRFPWDIFLAFKRSINIGSFSFPYLSWQLSTEIRSQLLNSWTDVFFCNFFFFPLVLFRWGNMS